jgi:large subunit ribosomal protein L4
MDRTVYSVQGKEVRTINLNDEVFAREVSEGSIYHAIKNELANLRVGTACTKSRSWVNGAKTKPWRQKGTGRARSGRKQSPVWVGGGIAFGPLPRDYGYELPRKIKKLAIKSVLSLKASTENLKVVENFTVSSGKTKDLMSVLVGLLKAGEKTLIILKNDDDMVKRAARNIPWVKFLTYNRLRAHDLFYTKHVVVMEEAALNLNSFYANDNKEV